MNLTKKLIFLNWKKYGNLEIMQQQLILHQNGL